MSKNSSNIGFEFPDKSLSLNKQSKELLEKIFIRAQTLEERINSKSISYKKVSESKIAKKRIKEWKEILSCSEIDFKTKRLKWGNLPSLDDLPIGEYESYKSEQIKFDQWIYTLSEIIELSSRVFDLETSNSFETEDNRNNSNSDSEFNFLDDINLPFQEVYAPAILLATDRIKNKFSNARIIFRPQAIISLQRSLLYNLVEIGADIFHRKFQLEKLLNNQETNNFPLYYLFLDKILNKNGLSLVFAEYPTFARMLATYVDLWVHDQINFIHNLNNDIDQLQNYFFANTKLTSIEEIIDGVSDAHNGRKSVKLIRFNNECKVVYKPRDINLLFSYNKFLAKLKEYNQNLDLKTLKILSKFEYGWVEFVEHKSCETKKSGYKFYIQAGELLAILYLLRGTDCHKENLIASAHNAFLVDAETLVNPILLDSTNDGDDHMKNLLQITLFDTSLLNIGLLPNIDRGKGQGDLSALGAVYDQEVEDVRQSWVNVNTDKMSKKTRIFKSHPRQNNAHYKNVNFTPDSHVEHICFGYRKVINIFKKLEPNIWKEWIKTFEYCNTRIIFRATKTYGNFIYYLNKPELLKEGIDRSIQIDILYRSQMEFTAKQPLWSLIESEIEQINNFDIPYFKMPVKSCTLELQNNNETIPVLPGYQLVNDRISNILNHDTSIFEEYIRTSCHLWSLRFNNNLPFDLRQNNEDPIRSLGDTELLKASEKICNQLQRRSIGDSQIGIGWLGLNLVGESSSLDLSPIDFNLYGGNSGLGLLFAANASILEEHSKDSSNSVQLALDSFLPIIEMIDFLKQSTNKHTNFPMGGFNGIGSIIYSLALSGLILDNPDWINHSIDLASLIRADDILTDTKLDVMSGCAGTLLSLISLNKIRSNQAVQDSICLCGEKLLSSQQEITTGKYSWRTLDNQPLTGFSHGAAGISLALFKLYELSLDKKYHDAALKAIVYENSEFSSQLNNWNDLRLGSTGSMVSWCNGACGIGLARLAILDICKEDIIMDDIKRAIEITRNDRTTYLHQICCGSMGHVELFLKAGIDLNDQSLINCARARATNILNTSSLNGGYNLLPRVPAKLIYPGFFQGRAGIAYELLRLINPYKLPCVLTLDLPI